MPRETTQGDEQRAHALEQTIREKGGGLSESSILSPEEARKDALLKKVREEGGY